MLARAAASTLGLLLIACAPLGSGAVGSGARVEFGTDGGGIAWGDGDYGVVLVHDTGTDAGEWEAAALAMAEQRMTALAPDRSDAAAVRAAIRYLRDERGLERVALVAAGSGGAAALVVGRESPELVDQLILISVPGDASSVAGLGEFPKLFAASSGEAAATAAEAMTGAAPGLWNAVFLAPGSASGQAIFDSDGGDELLDAILRRLDERR
ncbi:MAG: alpha/beta hydrolase [Candidatus Limnocylindria bacterium]